MTVEMPLVCGISIAVWLFVTVAGCLRRRSTNIVLPALTIGGCVLLLVGSVFAEDVRWSLDLPIYLADARFAFASDPLARWFVGIIAGIGIPVALFAPGYLAHRRQQLSIGLVWSGIALLMTSMVGVVLAANAITFMVAWEVMAFSSFALVASDHEQRSIRRAAFTYLAATRVGTAFLVGGFFWAYALTGTWSFADWHLSGAAATGPAALIFVGLATKAGCWPFHLWLPIAHPAAPAPVSALMSGVMIKTAIYAMIRLFVLGQHLNAPHLGVVVLVLGAVSAFWGIIFALLQHDLKRLLAYSSVENIGIILMGVGIALVALEEGHPEIAQIGLAAALLHSLNHAVFKSVLFLGTGAVESQTHTRSVDDLGGLAKKMPWTAGAFLVGGAAICALPPLNGFASEWLLYKSFLGLATDGGSTVIRLSGILLMGWLALVGALAVACFVKAVGVVFLGAPRSTRAKSATEASRPMVLAQAVLALACIGFGLLVPVVLGALSSVVRPIGATIPLTSAWNLPIAILALLLLLGVLAVAGWASGRPSRRFITWECGFGTLGPRTQYTAASFAQPISRLFGAIYRYANEVTIHRGQRQHFAQSVEVETVHEAYLETRLYTPIVRGFRRAAGGFIMRLQAGSIHQYLIYMLLALALLLWVGAGR